MDAPVDPTQDCDWRQEREWRWPIKVDEDGNPLHPDVPGLPIYGFKDVVITVKSFQEKDEIAKLLQYFYNDATWRFAKQKENLTTWRIVSADDLWSNTIVPQLMPLRIEDLLQNKPDASNSP